MNAFKIPETVTVTAPTCWMQKFTRDSDKKNFRSRGLWTWYPPDGYERYPHVSLSKDSNWEVDRGAQWVGFHLSVPLSRNQNGHVQYTIANDVVTFGNRRRTGLIPEALAEFDQLWNANKDLYLSFAQSFYKNALGGDEAEGEQAFLERFMS